MWKLYTISAFLLLGTLPIQHIYGQDIAPTGNFHRLYQKYRNAGNDSIRVAALLQLSNWYLIRAGDDRKNLDSATLLANEAANLSYDNRWPQSLEEARFLLAKTALKEKDWPGLRRLAETCDDSTRVRLALTAMNTHDLLKDVSPRDNDSARAFFHRVLTAHAPTRTPLRQTLLLLRLALYYRSRDDSVTGNALTLNSVDFNKITGAGNWNETLRHYLKVHLHSDPVATGVLAAAPLIDTRDTRGMTTLQRTAARSISYEAGLHWNKGELGLAEREYLLAIDMDRRCSAVIGWSYFTIIEFYLSNGNASKALAYGLEAVSRLQKTGNPDLEYEPYWCLGQVNYELGKPAVARGWYDSVLAIMHKKDQNPDAWLFKSVTQSYLKENDPSGCLVWLRDHVVRGDMAEMPYRQLTNQCYGDCYFALGDYQRAEPLYLDCYIIGSRINRYNQSLAALPLGQLYIRTKQYDKARTYLQPLLQPMDYYMVPLYIQRDVHLLLYMADSAEGNYAGAMRHLRTQQALNDSIFNTARNAQIQELTFRYETDRKDRDLRLQQEHIQLLNNEAQLQRASLQQVRTLRNTLIGASVLLVLLLAVLWSRYRTKQRANRLLRLKQNDINASNRELQRLSRRQQKLLAEKEWLMNEVHHRVKTNLQIVTSLLNMQVGYLNDEFTLHAFGEIGSRIRTLSLIHQRLYREDGDMTTINMRDYIHELSGYLLDTHDKADVQILRQIDPIELNITQCVPVGLILNEAITNALRFAFPSAPAGRADANFSYPEAETEAVIDIRMTQSADGRITLAIADNGIGLPPGFDPDRDAAMGLQLIKTLGEQLDGQTVIENRPTEHRGLRITVSFQRQESEFPGL